MGMGICGGAPSSFLVSQRASGGRPRVRDRRDYPARGRVETSPSGRVVHLCVILVLFQRLRVQNFRVLQAIAVPILQSCATRGPEVSHGQASKRFRRALGARRPRRAGLAKIRALLSRYASTERVLA